MLQQGAQRAIRDNRPVASSNLRLDPGSHPQGEKTEGSLPPAPANQPEDAGRQRKTRHRGQGRCGRQAREPGPRATASPARPTTHWPARSSPIGRPSPPPSASRSICWWGSIWGSTARVGRLPRVAGWQVGRLQVASGCRLAGCRLQVGTITVKKVGCARNRLLKHLLLLQELRSRHL